MASGVRADSKERLRQAVDRIGSRAHAAAVEVQNFQRQWEAKSGEHPWVAVLKKSEAGVTKFLVELAVAVYNDSMLETPAAWSWPVRSLATVRERQVWTALSEGGWDVNLIPTEPTAEALHYRDPDTYREMLGIVARLEKKKLSEKVAAGLVYSIQVDGSMDRQQMDNKFVTLRVVDGACQIQSYLAGVVEPEEGGAQGLLDSVKQVMQDLSLPSETMVGITTDGESANTGRQSGLWRRLNEFLGRQIITIWCVCHRSDLALESVEKMVPELQHWKSDLRALSSHFRMSKIRTKKLRENGGVVTFPPVFEVRFAEHLLASINAALSNLAACRKVWESVAESGSRVEKAEAKGFLRKWAPNGQTVRLTVLMADICGIFCHLQKKYQKGDLVLPEVLAARDAAVMQLRLMETEPLPGGQEEKLEDVEEAGTRCHNSNVTTKRNFGAVRQEAVSSAINFLTERLNVEQENVVSAMSQLLKATSVAEFIAGGRDLTSGLFGPESVSQFVTDVCDDWNKMAEARGQHTDSKSKLVAMTKCSSGVCKKLLSSLLCVAPHSMGTERAVSHYNTIRSSHRLGMHLAAANDRLMISVNGVGTASYDPRPAVAEFLTVKQRRNKHPDPTIYKQREFVKKFFRPAGSL